LINDTTEQPRPAPGYSPTPLAGDTLYVAGALGVAPDTGQIPAGGVDAEIHQMMRNLVSAVESAGLRADDIVSTTVYVTGFEFYGAFDAIYRSYFTQPFPARATVQVAGLVAGASIEISAIAVQTESESFHE
jgi:2-iminobutanoate/2-iminopropanoate deaminase